MGERRVLVTADDRTGALEAAALCADAGFSAVVVVGGGPAEHAVVTVVDLGTRHLAPRAAAAAAARAAGTGQHVAHKCDSALRGNWPEELLALAATRRVLLVPAFPDAGRTCDGGVVRVHGLPVDRGDHAADPRSRPRTARPATLLPGAPELGDLDAVRAWVAGDGAGIAVADARTTEDVQAAVAAASRHAVLVAGPAAVVGAWARDRAGAVPPTPAPWAMPGPVVVACASRHPVALVQMEALRAAGAVVVEPGGDVPAAATVVAVVAPAGAGGAEVASCVGGAARLAAVRLRAASLVVVGGDTAAGVVGDAPVRVHGSLGVGVACGRVRLDDRDVALVTKPGSFGAAGTVVDLVRHLLS